VRKVGLHTVALVLLCLISGRRDPSVLRSRTISRTTGPPLAFLTPGLVIPLFRVDMIGDQRANSVGPITRSALTGGASRQCGAAILMGHTPVTAESAFYVGAS
jgi:hypothetical protein